MASGSVERRDNPVSIVEALGDEYSLSILNLLTNEDCSAKEASDKLDIPIATVYRRMDDLLNANLIKEKERELTSEGKRVNKYTSDITEIKLNLSGETPGIELTLQSGPEKAIDSEWKDIKRS